MHSVNANGINFSGPQLNNVSTVNIRAPTGTTFALQNDLIVKEGNTVKTDNIDLVQLAQVVANIVPAPAVKSANYSSSNGKFQVSNFTSTQDFVTMYYVINTSNQSGNVAAEDIVALAVVDGNVIQVSSSTATSFEVDVPNLGSEYILFFVLKSSATQKESGALESTPVTVS